MRNNILILLVFAALIGCQKTKPQMPNKLHATKEDSAAVALVMMNQRLAEQTDKELLEYVKQHDPETFVAGVQGYWYKKIVKTDAHVIKEDMSPDVRLIISTLDGKMLIDSRQIVNFSDNDLIVPIRDVLLMMRIGEQAEVLIPWYAAYGTTGNQFVPPYANIKVVIETY